MEKPIIEQLLEIKRLHEAGILTKEEMEKEKNKILHPNRGDHLGQSVSDSNSSTQYSFEDTPQSTISEDNADKNAMPGKNIKWILGCIAGLILFFIIHLVALSDKKQEGYEGEDDTVCCDTVFCDTEYCVEEASTDSVIIVEAYDDVIVEAYDDDIYEIDEWAGDYVITGAIYRTCDSRANLSLRTTERKNYYIGGLVLLLGGEDYKTKEFESDGWMSGRVKAKLQNNQMVVVLDEFNRSSGEYYAEWFDELKPGQQIFCIEKNNGDYSVKMLGQMDYFFDGISCDNHIYKQDGL